MSTLIDTIPSVPSPPYVRAETMEARLRRYVDFVAEKIGVPAPERTILLKDCVDVQAYISIPPFKDSYELIVTCAVMTLPPEQTVAIIAHEIGHYLRTMERGWLESFLEEEFGSEEDNITDEIIADRVAVKVAGKEAALNALRATAKTSELDLALLLRMVAVQAYRG